MKYIVKVDYKRFVFKSGTTALDWAAIAKNAAVDDTTETEVTITLEKEPE